MNRYAFTGIEADALKAGALALTGPIADAEKALKSAQFEVDRLRALQSELRKMWSKPE